MKYVLKVRENREIKEVILNLTEENYQKLQEVILGKAKAFQVGNNVYSKNSFVSLEPSNEVVKVSENFRIEEPKRDEASMEKTLKQGFYNLKEKLGFYKNFNTYEEWVESRNKKNDDLSKPVYKGDIDKYRIDWTGYLKKYEERKKASDEFSIDNK